MKAAIFIAILTTCHAQYWTIFDGDQTSPRPRVCEDEARTFNDRAALVEPVEVVNRSREHVDGRGTLHGDGLAASLHVPPEQQ